MFFNCPKVSEQSDSIKGIKVRTLQYIHVLPLTGKPEQQRFTLYSAKWRTDQH